MKFKTNIRHDVQRIYGKYYYLCNRAVGSLSKEQRINKTAYFDSDNCKNYKVTCKNCLKRKRAKK